MSGTSRFERRLHVGLDEIAEPRFPDYHDDVLAVTSRRRQRPAWTFPGRWIPMVDITRRPVFAPTLPWRAIALLVALLLALVVGLLVVGAANRVPTPFGPARNGLIAYDTGGDIYVGDPASGQSRLVLANADTDTDPAWSRDGTLISFLRARKDNTYSVFVIKPDGSDAVEVTPPGGVPGLDFWDWGPDNGWIYYTGRDAGATRLYRAATDGSGATPIAPDLEIDSFSFRPPDGREMIVRTKVDDRAAAVIMSLDGSSRRTLVSSTTLPVEEHDLAWPRWSPDGTKVAYPAWEPGPPGQPMRIHVINADGSNDRTLEWNVGASFESWPVWSLDSKQIVFQRTYPTSQGILGFWHTVVIANADGSGESREISPRLGEKTVHLEFSPDGTQILLRIMGSGTQMILDPNGGPARSVPWSSWSYPNYQRLAP